VGHPSIIFTENAEEDEMRHKREQEWMREVELSQRNTVFPDTASNEETFWGGWPTLSFFLG
jgi:hypothetical protein